MKKGYLNKAPFLTEPEWFWQTHASVVQGTMYDGRNLDSSIGFITIFSSFYPGNAADPPSYPGPVYIDVGENAFGLSFVAPIYDPTRKYYFYQTHASDWAGRTGKVAAVGQTIPEPATCLLITLGLFLARPGRPGPRRGASDY